MTIPSIERTIFGPVWTSQPDAPHLGVVRPRRRWCRSEEVVSGLGIEDAIQTVHGFVDPERSTNLGDRHRSGNRRLAIGQLIAQPGLVRSGDRGRLLDARNGRRARPERGCDEDEREPDSIAGQRQYPAVGSTTFRSGSPAA
jgi:hypothetical protein